jgi:acetyl-CoA carboxylase alpha subunit
LGREIERALGEVSALTLVEMLDARYQKFRRMGQLA